MSQSLQKKDRPFMRRFRSAAELAKTTTSSAYSSKFSGPRPAVY